MHRRTLLKAAAVVPAAASVPLLGGALSPASAAPRNAGAVARGLDFPWGLVFLPDGDAFVTERNTGRVSLISKAGGARAVGTIPGVVHQTEDGAHGIALSPTFSTDGGVYVYHSTANDNRVSHFTYNGSSLTGQEAVITGLPHGPTHNGGGLAISSYPSLFVTVGDTRNTALPQDKSALGGKILRLKLDGTPQTGNPFIGGAGDDRIYSYGHRNPEGITIGDDGRVWSAELGENTWDELNQIVAGGNYGWPRVEGSDGAGGYRNPTAQWHPVDCSPSGVATLHGRAWIGALRGESLWSVDVVSPGVGRKTRYFHGSFGRIRNVKRAPGGDSLWITTSNGGGADKVIRIVFD